MGRFIGDRTTFSWKYESGTYANASGGEQWPGLCQTANVSEEINKRSERYINGGTRNVSTHFEGPRDTDVTFNSWVQDWRMLGFALGSIVTAGSPYTHTLSETNNDNTNAFTSGTDGPFISFSAQAEI